jgi:hypothetical protein
MEGLRTCYFPETHGLTAGQSMLFYILLNIVKDIGFPAAEIPAPLRSWQRQTGFMPTVSSYPLKERRTTTRSEPEQIGVSLDLSKCENLATKQPPRAFSVDYRGVSGGERIHAPDLRIKSTKFWARTSQNSYQTVGLERHFDMSRSDSPAKEVALCSCDSLCMNPIRSFGEHERRHSTPHLARPATAGSGHKIALLDCEQTHPVTGVSIMEIYMLATVDLDAYRWECRTPPTRKTTNALGSGRHFESPFKWPWCITVSPWCPKKGLMQVCVTGTSMFIPRILPQSLRHSTCPIKHLLLRPR